MTRAFFSYVREDSQQVFELVRLFEANGIETWIDQNNLLPGQNFHEEIRKGIQGGDFYVDVYSRNRELKERTYANRELTIAVEELQLRGNSAGWYIGVLLDDCNVPEFDIGAGRRLSDFQRAHLFQGWDAETRKLLMAVGVPEPVVPARQGVTTHLPSTIAFKGGCMTVTEGLDGFPGLSGMRIDITSGWCRKTDEGHLVAYLETLSPDHRIQKMIESVKNDKIYLVSSDQSLSEDGSRPNSFVYSRQFTMPKGFEAYDITSDRYLSLPFDLDIETRSTAVGYLETNLYKGFYRSNTVVRSQLPIPPFSIGGPFEVSLA